MQMMTLKKTKKTMKTDCFLVDKNKMVYFVFCGDVTIS